MTVHEDSAVGFAAALCTAGPPGSHTTHEVIRYVGLGGLPCSTSRLVLPLT